MKTLVFDTETTGKVNFRAPAEDPSQPRLVQLGAVLFDGTSPVAQLDCMVQPIGFEIPAEAAAVHGITTDKALSCGIQTVAALRLFTLLALKANYYVAYNCGFDLIVLAGEYHRLLSEPPFVETSVWHDPMQCATQDCKLPGKYGDYKWPKLTEAHQHYFGTPVKEAHSALADVWATARIFFHQHADEFKA